MRQCRYLKNYGGRRECALGIYESPPQWLCEHHCTKHSEKSAAQKLVVATSNGTPIRGAGDIVAAGIRKMTFGKVTPCVRCKKRQARLNRILPIGK